jgi:hypothetical protein
MGGTIDQCSSTQDSRWGLTAREGFDHCPTSCSAFWNDPFSAFRHDLIGQRPVEPVKPLRDASKVRHCTADVRYIEEDCNGMGGTWSLSSSRALLAPSQPGKPGHHLTKAASSSPRSPKLTPTRHGVRGKPCIGLPASPGCGGCDRDDLKEALSQLSSSRHGWGHTHRSRR